MKHAASTLCLEKTRNVKAVNSDQGGQGSKRPEYATFYNEFR